MGLNMQIILCIRFNFQIASDWLRLQFGVNLNSVKQVISRENDASLPFITWSLRVRYDVKHLHCTDAGWNNVFYRAPRFFICVAIGAILTPTSSSASPLSLSFCWHAWGLDQVLVAQSSCQSHPSILAMPRHQASVCHRLHRSRGFVPGVTDSYREGGARQSELLDLTLTSH